MIAKGAAILLAILSLTAFSIVLAEGVPYAVQENWDSWVYKAPMPTPRNSLGAVAVNGIIYAVGGDGVDCDKTEMYDPATDVWTNKTSMPTPRKSFGIAAFKEKIYVIGGLNCTDRNNDVITGLNEVYDPKTDTWQTKAPMPTIRYGISANVVNGKIYLIGGKNASGWIDGVNEVYDPETNSWTTKASMPTPVYYYASTVVDNKIYIIGGSNGAVTADLTQIYDPESDTWSNGAPIPNPVICACAVATSGIWAQKRIYVFGADPNYGVRGLYGDIYVYTSAPNQIYDPEKNTWSNGAVLPEARILSGVAVVDDILYVLGGKNTLLVPSFGDGTNQRYTPYGYGTIPPMFSLISPENKNYTSGNISLAFTINKLSTWIGYSLDGQSNVTITGNTTLTGLSSGFHNVTVFAKDELENMGASETVVFNISEPFPILFVIPVAAGVSLAIVGLGLLFFFRKRHSTTVR